ncbi:hypothetical protein H6F67_17315 [Microcoleus sp. FACHB-1515]|uniref:hypothetical protein n=1 Tax=Cyanophyceae TaxID=3028117 RepID=UPI001685F10F|nr:hypothetical protein [Microcoleus sp. FACHB-1515]MBD2091605.1 hypothetical protein [Microcoleus sp. FACHB-1515]
MHKLLLNLFAIPTVASSVLMTSLMVGVASATEVPAEPSTQASCAPVEAKTHSVRLTHTKNLSDSFDLLQTPNTDFSEAESDAAVTLFGCDCPSCIGALRQLQTQALSGSEGHCWGALQANVSPEEVRRVLQMLETQEAN